MHLAGGFARMVIAVAIDAMVCGLGAGDACADQPTQPQLVAQMNSPISDILQLTLQNIYAPTFYGPPGGQGNGFSILTKIPIRSNEVMPRNQMMLLTTPVAITRPGDPTGFGDIRLLHLVAPISRPDFDLGFGPTFIFPTASNNATG
jgi:hypothetical protein